MKRTTESLSGVLAAGVLLSGCGGSTPQDPAAPSVSRAASTSPASSPQATAAASPPRTVAAPPAPVSPPAAASRASGGITVNPVGAVLPNAARTPGAVNPSVSQANIGQTICASGWTATVRAPASFTTRLKKEQLASGYTYQGDTATRDYEEDHLISLEIGGAPTAEANLWPEPYNSPEGARVNDVVEGKLNALVCDHAITLATAQRAIATNWWTSYLTYVGPAPAH
jgi:hypothetical protein